MIPKKLKFQIQIWGRINYKQKQYFQELSKVTKILMDTLVLKGAIDFKDHIEKKYTEKKNNSIKSSHHNDIKQQKKEMKQQKKESVPINIHTTLEEELRSMSMIHPGVKQLNGVKGVHIKEFNTLSNVFSWNSQNVFGIFEGDSNGNQLSENSKPILYAVAKMNNDCSCKNCGLTEIAITESLDDKQSSTPFLYMKKETNCCDFAPCQLFINDQGNQTSLGLINQGYRKELTLSNDYVKKLKIYVPYCTCSLSILNYQVSDESNNKSIFTMKSNCYSCSNPVDYYVGFASAYNEDQKMLLLAMTIFMGFLNFESRNSKSRF